MKNRLAQIVVFLGLLFLSAVVRGQNTGKTYTDGDTSTINDIKKGSEFQYMLYLDSLLRTRQGMNSDTININQEKNYTNKTNRNSGDNSLSNYFLASSGISLFFQLIAVIIILFLVYKLVLKNIVFSKRRNRFSTEKNENGELEIMDVNQYNFLIRKAEADEHFNVAVKYYFLQVLKTLDDTYVIEFAPDKTNQFYLHQIPAGSKQKMFASLARIYEYVWYGKFEINKGQYQQFKKEFENFLSIIN